MKFKIHAFLFFRKIKIKNISIAKTIINDNSPIK